MIRIRSGVAVATVGALVLTLSGCSGDGDATPTTPVSPGAPSASPTSVPGGFEPDPAAATLGDAAPIVLIKTGSSWLYYYNIDTHEAQRIDISDLGTANYVLTIDGDVTWDGTQVAFDSAAPDIIFSDTNGYVDVFLRQVAAGSVFRISEVTGVEGNEGSYGPRISADGSTVVFISYATNLVPGVMTVPQVYRFDVVSGEVSLVNASQDGQSPYASDPSVSAGGRYIAFASSTQGEYGDDNYYGDVFVLDTETGAVEQVSVATDGTPGDFLSANPSISLNGRYVAFQSEASNLVGDDANTVFDVFIRDRATGETRLISRTSGGVPGNGDSMSPSMVGDTGVVFGSQASDLVPGDTNGAYDVFYADLATGTVQRLSVGPGAVEGNADSYPDAVYGARYAVFFTYATNLGGDGDDGPMRQYVYDLETGELIRFL